MNKKIKLSKEFEQKIEYVKNFDNDACRYICNIYQKYYLTQNKEDIVEYLNNNKCTFQKMNKK